MRTLEDVKQVCVSSALLATLSSWIWHTIYLTVHLVLLRQGKSYKTSLVHQHFHCVLCWAPFTWSRPHFSLVHPFPAPFPDLPLSVALTAGFPELRFHFVFFVGPRKIKLCVFVDQTSAASYYHWLLKGRVRWWLRLSWISFQKWWWIIALWIPVPCKYFCCLILS